MSIKPITHTGRNESMANPSSKSNLVEAMRSMIGESLASSNDPMFRRMLFEALLTNEKYAQT
jgi:hypothetical protein